MACQGFFGGYSIPQTKQKNRDLYFLKTRSFFEAVALVHVRFARVRFVLRSFLFLKPNFFLLHME